MKQLNQLHSWKKYLQWLILPLVNIIFFSFLVVTPALATGLYEIPNLTPDTWVVDLAEVISRVNEGKISNTFQDLAKQTGNEVRIITVRRLDYGETPETFTQGLFEKWFPSKQSQENQTILMINTAANGTAIVSGDKVKAVMSDDIAKSIANETLTAPLREGDKYNQAFLDASDRLVAVLSGNPDPGPPQMIEKVEVEGNFKKLQKEEKSNATAWIVGLLIAATVIPMATYYIYLAIQPPSSPSS